MKPASIYIGILLLAALAFSCARAETRYVSHAGSNTFPYTSWATAANTIQAANLATLPGDTMFIDTGSYYLSSTIYTQPKITIRGKGMDWTHILGDTSIYALFWPRDSTTWEDIHCIGHGAKRAVFGASYPETWSYFFRRCKFSNMEYGAISAGYNRYVEVKDCWFETSNSASPFEEALSLTDRGDYLIENNTFDMANSFFHYACLIDGYNSGTIVVRKNIFIGGDPPYDGSSGVGRLEMSNNLFYSNRRTSVAVYTSARVVHFANNSFFMTYDDLCRADAPLWDWGNDDTCLIYNNVIAGYRPQLVFMHWNYQSGADSVIKVFHNAFFSFDRCPGMSYFSAYYDSLVIDSAYGNVYADPMFVDPWNGDLRLQKGSPCIDAGAPWILDVDGTRSDIGAFGGPGGSFYIYQDFPPAKVKAFGAVRRGLAVDLSWQKNTESDFYFYVLFRSDQLAYPYDSAHVLAYFDSGGKVIGGPALKPPKRLIFSDTSSGKHLDAWEPVRLYTADRVPRLRFTDYTAPSDRDCYYGLLAVDSSLLVSEASTAMVGLLGPRLRGDDSGGVIPVERGIQSEGTSDLSAEENQARRDEFTVEQNYPNPFNATTAIVYSLPNIGAQPAPVKLTIYNALGQEVKTLVDEKQSPGKHIVFWNGDDNEGMTVATGVYFYRMEVSGIEFVKSGKMICLK